MPNGVKTENYWINSKSGVNFQVALEQNHTKRTHVKRDMPVLFQETEKICYCNKIQNEDKNTNKIT